MDLVLIAFAAGGSTGGATPGSAADLQAIVLNIYNLALLFGGLLAFVMILFASVKYTLQPGNSSAQGDAKDQILQAFFGLLLLFGAYLVLNTINPEIVNIEFPQLAKVEPPKEIKFEGVTDCSQNFPNVNECRSNYGSPNGCPQNKPTCVFDCEGGYKCQNRAASSGPTPNPSPKPTPNPAPNPTAVGCPTSPCAGGKVCVVLSNNQPACGTIRTNCPLQCATGTVCITGTGRCLPYYTP